MRKQLMKNNKGVSLLEFVVVMSIIMVMGMVLVWGMSLATNRPAEQCAKQMKIAIEQHRLNIMGKNSGQLEFFIGPDGYVWMRETINGSPVKEMQIGGKGITIKYSVPSPSGATETTLESTSAPIVVAFDRANGSLKEVVRPGASYFVTNYTISKGDVTRHLEINQLTGKVTYSN